MTYTQMVCRTMLTVAALIIMAEPFWLLVVLFGKLPT